MDYVATAMHLCFTAPFQQPRFSEPEIDRELRTRTQHKCNVFAEMHQITMSISHRTAGREPPTSTAALALAAAAFLLRACATARSHA